MSMRVMFIVLVPMGVVDRLMGMLMFMMFRQVQPNAQGHEPTTGSQSPTHGLSHKGR